MKSLTALILVLLSSFIYPQSDDFKSILNTGKNVITSPLRFDETDWLKFGGVLLGTAGSFYIDDDVKAMVLRNRTITRSGYVDDQWYYLGAMAITSGTYLYGYLSDDNDIRKLGIDLAEASLFASGINLFIKFAAGRNRPYTTTDVTEFHPFNKAIIHSSLASAHTTLAFAVASVFSKQSDNFIWKAAWYSAAGFIGAVRIYNNMHWFSDVFLGASIGYFVGSYVVDNKRENRNLEIGILPGGFSLRVNF